MWQSQNIFNVFNTLTLKQIFWKTKTFFKKLEYRFLVENSKIENALFPYKTVIQRPMLRQIKWWLQNGPIKKKGVLPVNTLFFWKFCSSIRTSYKGLTCCANDPNAHICTFYKRWSFIWRCLNPVSILKWRFNLSHWPKWVHKHLQEVAKNVFSREKPYKDFLFLLTEDIVQ